MRKPGCGSLPAPLPLNQIKIDDPFWNRHMALVPEEIIPYQYRMLGDLAQSHCIENFRIAAGLAQGTFWGHVFQDTDLAKWLEAVAYSLSYRPDPELEKTADEMIELVGKAQQENGYLNTHFTILHPGKQYCNLKEGHELYTAGHFIEAVVAYYQVTGKTRLLEIMCKCADHICQVFRQPDYLDGVPGHEEIELALIRLAEVTGKQEYADMALEFVNRRGCSGYLSKEHTLERFVDCWHDRNPYLPQYGQAHKPVREQDTAEGHAVRALYLYSAMADLAERYQDDGLLRACERLYDNIVSKRMYITGGVGSSGTLERFTTDYDLPNDTNYSESCASIALAMFCKRMARITGEARYMDTAELALMNTVLAGVSLDGKRFFYVNPLEVIPEACMSATDKNHVKPTRQKWFGCACCPPNIARTLASLGEYTFFRTEDALWMNMFVSGEYETRLQGTPVTVRVESGLPYTGRVKLTLTAESPLDASLWIRIPEYAQAPRLTLNAQTLQPELNRGYARIPLVGTEAAVEFRFDMLPRLVYANPRVASDAGKCAIRKGPLVYCLEQQDNGENLAGLIIHPGKPLEEVPIPGLPEGTLAIRAQGFRLKGGDGLYTTQAPHTVPSPLTFVPYYAWGNRESGEMTVWVKYVL